MIQQKSMLPKEEVEKPPCKVTYNESPCLETTISTGFTHNDKPVVDNILPSYILKPNKHPKEDSIMDSVDTGFGSENKLINECKKPKYKTHLFKEDYLSDFKTDTEKKKVRNNLDVYSREEVISHIIKKTENFITKEKLKEELDNIDFTDSEHKSYAKYEIPNNLFE